MATADHALADLLDPAFERLARLEPGWEDRPGQRAMALRLAQLLERGGILAVEAPTGIGKSLAYLLPCLLLRLRGSGPIWVSTHTKALQDQLLARDVPLALRALGRPLRVATLKGRANYLCRRRAEARLAQREIFGSAAAEGALERLRSWMETTRTGALEDLEREGIVLPSGLTTEIASDPFFCAGSECDAAGGCFAKRARREAGRSDVVLVNHALLLSDAGLRASLLPEAGALVIDEAHHLERVAREQLGVSIGVADLLRLAGRTDARTGALRTLRRSLPRGRGGIVAERLGAAERSIAPVLSAAAALARDLEALLPPGTAATRLTADVELARVSPAALDELLAAVGALARALEALVRAGEEGTDRLRAGGAEALEETRARRLAWGEVEQSLRAALDLADRGSACYIDRDERGGPRLNRRPIRVGPALRGSLFSVCERVALTSATLRAGADFGPVLASLGLGADDAEAVALPSPFALERQVFCAVLNGRDPNDAGFPDEAAAAVRDLALALRRNTLVLLTSYQMLGAVRERLAPALAGSGIRLLAQEPGESAAALADSFREGCATVLLGVASFWEGVDFPGSALEVLVIARLPFGVPTDPVFEARSEQVAAEGGDPFRDLALPEALLRFRQGLGRLIRSARDRGAAVVLDPRAARASYAASFLAALPSRPRILETPEALAREAGAWFAREAEPCPA